MPTSDIAGDVPAFDDGADMPDDIPLIGQDMVALVSLTVENVDYAALVANDAAYTAFISKVKEAIAAEAGNGVAPADVELRLSPGSVKIEATVRNVGGASTDVQSALNASKTLSSRLVRGVKSVPGIQKAQTGVIAVSDISVRLQQAMEENPQLGLDYFGDHLSDEAESETFTFTVELEKRNMISSSRDRLGLDVNKTNGRTLVVLLVHDWGMVKKYNKGVPHEIQIKPGDEIISVNDVRDDSLAMLELLKNSMRLTLVVERPMPEAAAETLMASSVLASEEVDEPPPGVTVVVEAVEERKSSKESRSSRSSQRSIRSSTRSDKGFDEPERYTPARLSITDESGIEDDHVRRIPSKPIQTMSARLGADADASGLEDVVAYLPIAIHGDTVLQAYGENTWRADTAFGREGPGLAYRSDKSLTAESSGVLEWGKTVQGVNDGDGWVRVLKKGSASSKARPPAIQISTSGFDSDSSLPSAMTSSLATPGSKERRQLRLSATIEELPEMLDQPQSYDDIEGMGNRPTVLDIDDGDPEETPTSMNEDNCETMTDGDVSVRGMRSFVSLASDDDLVFFEQTTTGADEGEYESDEMYEGNFPVPVSRIWFMDPRGKKPPLSCLRAFYTTEGVLGQVDATCNAKFLRNSYDVRNSDEEPQKFLMVLPCYSGKEFQFRNAEAAFLATQYSEHAEEFQDLSGKQALDLIEDGSFQEDENYAGYESRWNAMKAVIKAKFRKNSWMAKCLLSTEDDLLLAHDSPGQSAADDHYWSDGHDGTGMNYLGLLLMMRRDKLAKRHDEEKSWTRKMLELRRSMRVMEDGYTPRVSSRWKKTVADANKALKAAMKQANATP
jgi:hypothetical protein